MSSPILCIGDSLFAVLADLRARGARVMSLDTGVNSNAGYRVSFSEACGGIGRRSLVTGRAAPEDGFISTTPGSNPGKPPVSFSEGVASGKDDGAGSSRTPVRQLTASGGETPPVLATFPHQCETPARSRSSVAVKSEIATRDPLNGREIPRHRPAFGAEMRDKTPEKVVGAETVGVEASLETRLQQLYEKAVKSGRVRARFKTSTAVEHARVPYRDE